eukprot:6477480-Amphidinium_carterae.1
MEVVRSAVGRTPSPSWRAPYEGARREECGAPVSMRVVHCAVAQALSTSWRHPSADGFCQESGDVAPGALCKEGC